jgi:hypothetical protein
MRKGAKVFIEHDARPVTVVHLVEVFRGRLAAAGSQLRGVPLPNRHLWNFFKSLIMFLGGVPRDLKSRHASAQLSVRMCAKEETTCIDAGYVKPFPHSLAYVRIEIQNQVTLELTPIQP